MAGRACCARVRAPSSGLTWPGNSELPNDSLWMTWLLLMPVVSDGSCARGAHAVSGLGKGFLRKGFLRQPCARCARCQTRARPGAARRRSSRSGRPLLSGRPVAPRLARQVGTSEM